MRSRLTWTPALKLVGVLAMAMALQSPAGLVLGLLLTGWVLLVHRHRFMKLLRRMRLLLVVLFAVTLLMTPGSALWPEWGLYPTREGVMLALTQLIRLLGMLATVTLLLESTDRRSLAAGCLALLSPLAGRAQWPERAVARLLLVFDYLETAPPPRNLQEVLAMAGMNEPVNGTGGDPQAPPESITLADARLTGQDMLLGAGLLLLSAGAFTLGPLL